VSFAEAGKQIIEGTAAGLYESATIIMAESQPLVPVLTGTLKRSGHVEEPVIEGDTASVTLGYAYGVEYESTAQGDEETGPGYAIYVHEILENKHKPPTSAKFLEIPARAFEPELGPTIERNVRARLHS
jgi:hypothetical protein